MDERFEAACVTERIRPSLSEYVYRAARVKRLTGMPLGYTALRRYFRLKAKLAASTLRGVKSAVIFILDLHPQTDAPLPRREVG